MADSQPVGTRGRDPEFAKRVSRLKEARGASFRGIAADADIGTTTVVNAVAGLIPNVPNLIALARALGVTVSELLGEDIGVGATLERTLPGWFRLTPDQQTRIRETVADLAAARPSELGDVAARLTPDELAAVEQGRAFQARANRLRAAESPGTYQAGAEGGDTKKPAAPRRRGTRKAAGG